KEQKLAFNIKENIYYSGIDGYVIRVAKKGKDGNSLKKVMIYDHTGNDGNTKVSVADSGYMQLSTDQQNMYLKLFNGYNFEEETKDVRKRRKDPLQRTYFKEQIVKFDLSGFDLKRTDENLFRNNYHMLNLQQLSKARDSLTGKLESAKSKVDQRIRREGMYHYSKYADDQSQDTAAVNDTLSISDTLSVDFLEQLKVNEQVSIIGLALSSARRSKNQVEFNGKSIARQERLIRKHDVEWHRKFTLSFACLVLFFIGAPLGAIIRKGGLGLPLVISIFFFVTYHIISITGEKYAEAGVLPVYEGMWLASVILLPLGFFLTIKATTDAPLLDTEAWKKKINQWQEKLRSGK
ncbi:MAG TPA: LptF/LptG family permease, partial [Bacteroidales bacterium]|nr:LptF/LptG family permease [Bacteroidales bacterium]